MRILDISRFRVRGRQEICGSDALPALLRTLAQRSRLSGRHRTLTTASGALTLYFDNERGGPPGLQELMRPHVGKKTHFYGCGPASMLAAYESALAALGQGNVHLERFAAAPPAPKDAAEGDAANGSYEVGLRRSKRVIVVKPGQTLLEAVAESGVYVDSSCCEGVCGACERAVIEGEVIHQDSLLSDEERAAGKTMMICVSRARGARLVSDL